MTQQVKAFATWTWSSDFDLQNPCRDRKELTPQSCSMTPVGALWLTHCTHNNDNNNNKHKGLHFQKHSYVHSRNITWISSPNIHRSRIKHRSEWMHTGVKQLAQGNTAQGVNNIQNQAWWLQTKPYPETRYLSIMGTVGTNNHPPAFPCELLCLCICQWSACSGYLSFVKSWTWLLGPLSPCHLYPFHEYVPTQGCPFKFLVLYWSSF